MILPPFFVLQDLVIYLITYLFLLRDGHQKYKLIKQKQKVDLEITSLIPVSSGNNVVLSAVCTWLTRITSEQTVILRGNLRKQKPTEWTLASLITLQVQDKVSSDHVLNSEVVNVCFHIRRPPNFQVLPHVNNSQLLKYWPSHPQLSIGSLQ